MKRAFLIHPFLFAIYPVLFVFATNKDEFHPGVVAVPIALATCLALVSLSFLSLLLSDTRKAGLVVSLFFLLLFSYENVYDCLKDFVRGLGVRRVWTGEYLRVCVLVTWTVLFAVAIYILTRRRGNLYNVTRIANVVACVLVVISVVNIGAYEVKTMSAWQADGGTESVETNPTYLEEPDVLPDIYYIILDGYGRADVLKDIYEYDNSEFLDYLTGKGFFVANRSRSNYAQTGLSLASSLNMRYLDDPVNRIGIESWRLGPANYMILNNSVFGFLKDYGYAIVAFASGWSVTGMRSADTYMAARWYPDQFQNALIDMTPIPFVVEQLGGYDRYGLHRERILYAFEHLADTSQLEGPTFVFAHMIAPHPPFVFGPHGEEIEPDYRFTLRDGSHVIRKRKLSRDEYVQRYREQLIFVNSRIEGAVDGILSKSTRPTIIILQADHGPGSMPDCEDPSNTYFKERFSILNAYYLPNGGGIHLFDDITPVNTFRIVLNHYFGTEYELLKDQSYFSTWSNPYAFIDVTDQMNDDVGVGHPE